MDIKSGKSLKVLEKYLDIKENNGRGLDKTVR
jgi:hypothetical protein